jgi:hypothetical protein
MYSIILLKYVNKILNLQEYSLCGIKDVNYKEVLMARYKSVLKKIHRKKMRKAKEKVRKFYKGEIPYEKLNVLTKNFLAKRKRKEKKSA